ncbi:MAG: type II toxin-antitoxin system HicB family antitoxin [Magnetococcales bacterium]|nr:type II toxin-antitoxin system HicB family antitoxin [Magnetococcales bacterium]
MSSNKDRIDGYTVEVWEDDDGDWMACLVEMPSISAFSDSPEAVVVELETAWQAVKESYQKAGEVVPVAPSRRTYSGDLPNIDTRGLCHGH